MKKLALIPMLAGALALPGSAADQEAEKRVEWFTQARFGMFIHWGLYSELAGSWDGHTLPDPSLKNGKSWYSEWVQMRLEVPAADYQKLALSFNPTKFDADQWALEAKLAGMRYLVITSKHHDGFALWDSKVSEFDLGSSPCKRDILGELTKACRAQDIKVGFYYSHWQDWEHPGGAMPMWDGMPLRTDEEFQNYWESKSLPQVRELLELYEPDMLWFDTWGSESKPHITPARRDELIDLVRSIKPDCLINGRICNHDPGPRIDYISAHDNQHFKKNPGCPWQTPATMYHSWAWHANDFNWKPSDKMIDLLATNASLGGNYLLNIGPKADGTIPAPNIRRMREIGGWVEAHKQAIYGTQPMDDCPAPKWGVLTTSLWGPKDRVIYAFVKDWQDDTLTLPEEAGTIAHGVVLETGQELEITADSRGFKKPKGAVSRTLPVMKLWLKTPAN